MIQAYTKNTTVAANATIPLNNVSTIKGCTTTTSGNSAISLNKKGVYMVSVDAIVTAGIIGIIQFQLSQNGTLLPQAITAESATDITGQHALSFVTLIKVEENACRCDCSTPDTIINFVNNGVQATYNNFNVVVTKIC